MVAVTRPVSGCGQRRQITGGCLVGERRKCQQRWSLRQSERREEFAEEGERRKKALDCSWVAAGVGSFVVYGAVTERREREGRRWRCSGIRRPKMMNLLNLGNSWKLLCDEVFGQKHDFPLELKKVGKKIVEKSQGLPLMISVLAGHLSKMARALHIWKDFARSLAEIIASHPEKCFGVLEGFIRTPGSGKSSKEVAVDSFDGSHPQELDNVSGEVWRLSDEDKFGCLKLLLFSELYFECWEATCDNFPNLKRLVLKKCNHLKEIPTDFGEICTLESIELHNCCTAAGDSARNILNTNKLMWEIIALRSTSIA
ncbi:putative peroxidase 56-like [Capsicum annuum]|nr:putative peroxidase 56-like [Capsicum annuum]